MLITIETNLANRKLRASRMSRSRENIKAYYGYAYHTAAGSMQFVTNP